MRVLLSLSSIASFVRSEENGLDLLLLPFSDLPLFSARVCVRALECHFTYCFGFTPLQSPSPFATVSPRRFLKKTRLGEALFRGRESGVFFFDFERFLLFSLGCHRHNWFFRQPSRFPGRNISLFPLFLQTWGFGVSLSYPLRRFFFLPPDTKVSLFCVIRSFPR